MLSKLYGFTVEASALAATAVIFAMYTPTPGVIIGAALFYLFARGLFKTFLGTSVPSPVLTFLYVLTYYGLIGLLQFLIMASVVIAVFTLKEARLWRGPWDEAVMAPLKMGLLGGSMSALLIPVLIAPVYFLWKHYKDTLGKLAGLALIGVMLFYAPQTANIAASALTHAGLSPLAPALAINYSNPLLWMGLIGYEELLGRPTPAANAWFVALHAPSRLAEAADIFGESISAVGYAVFVVGIIGLATVWLRDIYTRYGLIPSIVGHAVYNASVSAPLMSPLAMAFMAVGLIAYFYKWRHE